MRRKNGLHDLMEIMLESRYPETGLFSLQN